MRRLFWTIQTLLWAFNFYPARKDVFNVKLRDHEYFDFFDLRSSESTQEGRIALGYRLEQLLRFFRALQTSRVHP